MTYELLEEANNLYKEIEHLDSMLNLFTTRSLYDDDRHHVILQRVDDPHDRIHFGTDKLYISDDLACAMFDVVYAEKEKLEREFSKLGENY